MSFHPPKKNNNVIVSPPDWKVPKKKQVPSNQNLMLDAFKAMAIDMKRRKKSDKELILFAEKLTPQSLGLEPNYYVDHIFVQLQERTSLKERINALEELAAEGKI